MGDRSALRVAMAAAMIGAAGLGVSFPAPEQPEPPIPRRGRKSPARIILGGATGDVVHTFTDKPLSKRAKRRLRGRKAPSHDQ